MASFCRLPATPGMSTRFCFDVLLFLCRFFCRVSKLVGQVVGWELECLIRFLFVLVYLFYLRPFVCTQKFHLPSLRRPRHFRIAFFAANQIQLWQSRSLLDRHDTFLLFRRAKTLDFVANLRICQPEKGARRNWNSLFQCESIPSFFDRPFFLCFFFWPFFLLPFLHGASGESNDESVLFSFGVPHTHTHTHTHTQTHTHTHQRHALGQTPLMSHGSDGRPAESMNQSSGSMPSGPRR